MPTSKITRAGSEICRSERSKAISAKAAAVVAPNPQENAFSGFVADIHRRVGRVGLPPAQARSYGVHQSGCDRSRSRSDVAPANPALVVNDHHVAYDLPTQILSVVRKDQCLWTMPCERSKCPMILQGRSRQVQLAASRPPWPVSSPHQCAASQPRGTELSCEQRC